MSVGSVAGGILLTLSILLASLAAEAQQPAKVARIGILNPGPLAPRLPVWEAFRQGLRELGYVEGQNIVLEFRSLESESGRLDDHAADLARLKVDVIVTLGTQATQAAKRATGTIPIVMGTSVDPVETGLVASLARPGGNVTGQSLLSGELSGKRLELLREIAPRLSRVAVFWNPTNPGSTLQLRGTEAAARALGVQLVTLEVRQASDIEAAFQAATKRRADALVPLDDPVIVTHQRQIVALAAKSRLPAIYGLPGFAEDGGLVVYGPNTREMFRRAATFVDKILKGARPADIPVEQPTRFELVINLKTAKALGLTIPQSVLIRADKVIE